MVIFEFTENSMCQNFLKTFAIFLAIKIAAKTSRSRIRIWSRSRTPTEPLQKLWTLVMEENLLELWTSLSKRIPKEKSPRSSRLMMLHVNFSKLSPNQKIPFSADTAMFLINALYLKADWAEEFYKSDTKDMDFHMKNGVTNKVSFILRILVHYFMFISN